MEKMQVVLQGEWGVSNKGILKNGMVMSFLDACI